MKLLGQTFFGAAKIPDLGFEGLRLQVSRMESAALFGRMAQQVV